MSTLSNDLYTDFTVHPRKRVCATPVLDCAGDPMPITLGEVYGRYSDEKARAYRYCRRLCEKYDGHNFCIMSHNVNMFTVSFDFANPDNGLPMRAVITRCYNHAYYIG